MSLFGFGHPKKSELAAWINGEQSELDGHIETCDKCASRIEQIDDAEGDRVGAALKFLLAPPNDLRPRLEEGIATSMNKGGDLSLLGDLLGIPLQTVRVLSQGSDVTDG